MPPNDIESPVYQSLPDEPNRSRNTSIKTLNGCLLIGTLTCALIGGIILISAFSLPAYASTVVFKNTSMNDTLSFHYYDSPSHCFNPNMTNFHLIQNTEKKLTISKNCNGDYYNIYSVIEPNDTIIDSGFLGFSTSANGLIDLHGEMPFRTLGYSWTGLRTHNLSISFCKTEQQDSHYNCPKLT